MIRHNFRSSPWAAQAPLPGDAPSSPSPSAPREFPSGPVHQKAILCLTEMDIDPIAMQLYGAAKVIAPADFRPWPVTSPGPPVPSVHPTRSWPHTSSASFRLWARLVTTLFPVSVHFWTDFGPIFIPSQLLRACCLAQGALSRVTARLVTGFVTGFSQKSPVKCGLSRCHGSRGRVYTPHLAGAHSRQHATRYRPLDPITSGSLPPSGSWVVSGAF